MAKRRQQINRQLRRETREQKGRERFLENPTPKKARHIAGAEANTTYKPVLRGLRSEVAGSKKREGELANWYGGLNKQISSAQQSAAATSQAAESALTQRLADASASDQSALKETAQKNEALGKLLGTNQVGVSNAPSASAGATALAQQRVALSSPLTTERASYQNYLGQRGVSATERGIEARKAETSRRRKIKEDLRAGKKERGSAVVSNLEKLREGARDYAIQKQAFGQKGKELGLKAREGALNRRQNETQDLREQAQDERASKRTAQNNVRSNAQDERASIRSNQKPKAPKGGASSKAIAAARNQYEAGTKDAEGNHTGWNSWGELATAVAKESEVTPAEARAAVNRIKKRVEAKNAKQQKRSAVKKAVSGF